MGKHSKSRWTASNNCNYAEEFLKITASLILYIYAFFQVIYLSKTYRPQRDVEEIFLAAIKVSFLSASKEQKASRCESTKLSTILESQEYTFPFPIVENS